MSDAVKVIEKGTELIKTKKIQNLDQFYLFLDEEGISKKEFIDGVSHILDGSNLKKKISLGLFLGEAYNGIGLLPYSWWERRIDDYDLRKEYEPKWWPLFRDKQWVEENKVTRD